MRLTNRISSIFLAVGIILLMVNPATAAPIEAYAGYISDDRVTQDSTVQFSGTFHNFGLQEVYLASFNVSFVERLGEGATRDPNRPNISRFYESDRRSIPVNTSFTETLSEKIDMEPGAYNVSIFFQYSNDTNTINAATILDSTYALINQTFVVEGETESLVIARYIGIGILITVVGIIGILIYNAKFKKSY